MKHKLLLGYKTHLLPRFEHCWTKAQLFLILTILLCSTPLLEAQIFDRAVPLGGPGKDYSKGIQVDAEGNIYSTGIFKDSIDFDPGPGKAVLYTQGNTSLFIQKTDAQGNFLWAKQIIGIAAPGIPRDFVVDPAGNIFLICDYTQPVDVDPGPGIHMVDYARLVSSTFLLKLDKAGNFIWVRGFESKGTFAGMSCTDLAISPSGSIYMSGWFIDSIDFNPGPGYAYEYVYTNTPTPISYVLKLDAAGNFVWVNKWLSPDCSSIALDQKGHLFCQGGFNATVDFDPGPGEYNLTTAGGNDIYIQKLDTSGHFIWAKSIGGLDNEGADNITLDAANNIIIRGSFNGPTDFDPGPGTFIMTTNGQSDMFLEKLTGDGNFLWAVQFGGFGSDAISSIGVDELGFIYAVGTFSYTVDFDPGPGVQLLTASTGPETKGFMLKLDPLGYLVWVTEISKNCGSGKLCIAPNGQIFTQWTISNMVNLPTNPPLTFVAQQYDVLTLKYLSSHELAYFGTVYNDLNGNNIREYGEPGLRGIKLKAPHSGKYGTTNILGEYRIYSDILIDTLWVTPPWSTWNANPTFHIPDGSQAAMDFALTGPQSPDICIAAVELGPFRPGFTTQIFIQVTNVGTVPVDAIPVVLRLVTPTAPLNLEYVSSIPVPVSHSATEFNWFLDHLNVYETKEIRLKLRTPTAVPIGANVTISTSAILAEDVYQTNNGSRILAKTVGSVDPNDKTVTPARVTPFALDTTDLRYVIRFQNTGNYPADFVVIRDTLSAELDLASLKILAASHPYTWRIYGDRILEFRFDGIYLPDSTANEPESHGFIAFTVMPKNSLPLGTIIPNRAGIYFDFNDPVITNTSEMLVANVVRLHEPAQQDWIDFKLSPNPVAAFSPVLVELPTEALSPIQVRVYDTVGKKIQEWSIPPGDQKLYLKGLPKGSYFVQVRVGNLLGGKLLIVE